MAKRPVDRKNTIGALPLALTFTALYVVLAGAAGYLALDDPAPTAVAAPSTLPAGPTTTATPTTATTTTASTTGTTSTSALPPDVEQVTAPGGLTTVVPAGWRRSGGTVATTLVAVDPASPREEVRFGGAPVTDPSKSLLDRITEAAAQREREPAHRRLTLAATTVRDHPAVGWEFEDVEASGPTRVATVFWEVDGVEYVLYSAGPPERWENTRSRLKTMADLSSP
ncbi:hypothetical protein [Saccharothrix hoggarensis]|uniref:Fibronectin attachment protein n=1 Tax=Saccharothrix hoggarensis TaxID=913853 RepID=A0ABW3QXR6_9PSEU